MKECPACRRCFPDDINHCPQDGDATTPSLLGEPILDARYQLERRLGQGGMGVVFQARHIFLKTSHAIKVILPDLVGNDPMLVTRFRQEALAAAAIRHQNIIAVTDFGVVRGTMPFLVMEFVNGKSLQDILAEEGVMAPARALDVIGAIAAGVGAAHKQNIVHRDLKPLNIMIQNGMPIAEGLKILDFGLAKIKSGELLGSFVQAKTSGLMGSPFYMAPEQWSDEEPDARADIYSLGIILYQMLCGDVPFKGSSIPSIMKKHLTLPVPSFQSLGVQVPPALEAAVRHALEKEVESRTASAEAFLAELRHALDSSRPPVVTSARDTGAIDFNKTVATPFTATGTNAPPEETGFGTSFDSMAGTVSAASLDSDVQQQVAIAGEAYRREQDERDRIAREEIAREADHKRKVQEEADRKRKDEEERVRREKADQEEKEKQQREQIERVARQAKELEERLERLATSMPPQAAVLDPEATQVHKNVLPTEVMGYRSFPSAPAPVVSQRPAVVVDLPPPKTKRPGLMIGAVVLILLLLGGGIGAYYALRPQSDTPAKRTDVPVQPPTIKADMAQIEGGSFMMGRDAGPLQEKPAHQIKVQSFFMDKTEVTNAEYAEFVRETNYPPPAHWSGTRPPQGIEQWPVVNVTFEDANAFARWRSKRDNLPYRLPTEEEWEYAARNGDRNDLYPWGKGWKDNLAVLKGEGTPSAVGSRPDGKNRWDVVDLIGNVWEWTSSKVSAYPGNPTTIPSSTQDWMAIRGGGYFSDPADKDNPVSSCMRSFITPTAKNTQLGFRLVRSAS
jgi:serine/threonine protein kinase/formylglycine-generating enzyme required for sulfatase activity